MFYAYQRGNSKTFTEYMQTAQYKIQRACNDFGRNAVNGYSLMDASRKDLSVITLKKLCDGLDMTITEFFDDELFKTLEQEIR